MKKKKEREKEGLTKRQNDKWRGEKGCVVLLDW